MARVAHEIATPSQPQSNGASQLRRLPALSRQRDVAAQIKDYIARNELKPGDQLPGEEWFASELGVGRPLVREVLKGLEAVGAVETRKGVGRFVGAFEAETYLSHFTTEVLIQSFEARELVEVRCLLEIAAVADVVDRLTDESREELVRLLEGMRERIARGEVYVAEDFGMHRTIMRHADNRFIVAMLDAIYALSIAHGAAVFRPESAAQDLAEHEAIVAAILARDGEAARAALMAHFETTARRTGFHPLWRHVFGATAEGSRSG
jgi:GntR family transcriptional repressor for pyruvate dehydrogenase complex